MADSAAAAPELIGVYSRTDRFYGETLELNAANRFEYSDWCCVGKDSASGTWRVVGDSVELTRIAGSGGLFLVGRDDDVSEVHVVVLRIIRSDESIDLANTRPDELTADELRELSAYQVQLGLPPLEPGWNHLRRVLGVSTESRDAAKAR